MNTQIQPVDILLVEDNPDDAKLTIRALKKRNVSNNIFIVKDGEEALDFIFAKGNCPKLILLDIKLPKVSGIEVLKQIKSNEKTKTIPVVMLTSSREEPDIKECYKLSVNSYIVKPVDFEKFSQIIEQLNLYWLVVNQPPV